MPVTIKVTHGPSDTTRKVLVPTNQFTAYASLLETVLERFSLSGPADLSYYDEDMDLITLSSDAELKDLLMQAQKDKKPIRCELRQLGTQDHPERVESTIEPTKATQAGLATRADPSEGATREQDKQVETKNVRSTTEKTSEAPLAEPSTPTLLFEDPDETPLPNTSAQEARPTSVASSTVSSSAHPGSFPDDPREEPLPSSFPGDLPFSNLPNSLSSFLASLGTRSSTFSSTLASALSPTSPHSPTSRLSTILSASSLDDIPIVASSLVQMGTEFAEIAKDVALGVRREADEIRGEFTKLRAEVERERERFRDEMRTAFNQAATTHENDEDDLEMDNSTPTGPHTNGPPSPPSVAPYEVPGSTTAESTIAESRASSVAPSSITPSTSHSPANATSSVSRGTSRLLHKQAKQARKDYRAAVRQAREEKKRSTSTRGTSEVAAEETPEQKVPGGMPNA
ncbi:hypothetical protein JCM16303_007429 [Sporobolomyces ruberrimus]